MSFTATLDAVEKSSDPAGFTLQVTYLDSDNPDWRVSKALPITVDPNQTAAQQRASIRAQVVADAQRYKRQLEIHAGLTELVGQSIEIP